MTKITKMFGGRLEGNLFGNFNLVLLFFFTTLPIKIVTYIYFFILSKDAKECQQMKLYHKSQNFCDVRPSDDIFYEEVAKKNKCNIPRSPMFLRAK